MKRSSFVARAIAFGLGAALAAVVAVLALRTERSITIESPTVFNAPVFGYAKAADEITVSAAAGWQLSQQVYKKDDVVCVEPSGWVTNSSVDVANLAAVMRPLLAKFAASGTKLAEWKRKLPPLVLSDGNRFRFGWTGPEGEHGPRDDMFGDCLLDRSAGWGALLVVEMRDLGYGNVAERDPLQLLQEDQRAVTDIHVMAARREFTFTTDSHLAFIVNDAVLSERFGAERAICGEAALALAAAQRVMATDVGHNLAGVTAPLLAYTDNAGAFYVRVKRGACGTRSNARLTMPAIATPP